MFIAAIDDDPILLHTVQMVLEEEFGEIVKLNHPQKLEDALSMHPIQVVILDLNFHLGHLQGDEGLTWITRITDKWEYISIVVLTAHGLLDIAVKSLKHGATDFLEKPFTNEKLVATVQAAKNLSDSKIKYEKVSFDRGLLIDQFNRLPPYTIGPSLAMRNLYKTLEKVANTNASVLLIGEHGTGKEVIARLIHQKSQRVTQAFVPIDLNTIVDSLFESTLFGHITGAFTDAKNDKIGLFELANFGTLFLNEIDNISLVQQSKLLHVLQEGNITRVGSNQEQAIDLRVISASSTSLDDQVQSGAFRQDLLFRINTIVIHVPPLRDRREDIPDLLLHFLKVYNKKYGKSLSYSKKEINDLMSYNWPGNIRELQNMVERSVIMSISKELYSSLLSSPRELHVVDNLYDLEKEKIVEIIDRHQGNISKAAKELGIGRNTLYRKMRKYDI